MLRAEEGDHKLPSCMRYQPAIHLFMFVTSAIPCMRTGMAIGEQKQLFIRQFAAAHTAPYQGGVGKNQIDDLLDQTS